MSKHTDHLGALADCYPDAYEDEECDQCGGLRDFHFEGCIYKCPVDDSHEN